MYVYILTTRRVSEVRAPAHVRKKGVRHQEPEEWGGVKVGHAWADASEDEVYLIP